MSEKLANSENQIKSEDQRFEETWSKLKIPSEGIVLPVDDANNERFLLEMLNYIKNKVKLK